MVESAEKFQGLLKIKTSKGYIARAEKETAWLYLHSNKSWDQVKYWTEMKTWPDPSSFTLFAAILLGQKRGEKLHVIMVIMEDRWWPRVLKQVHKSLTPVELKEDASVMSGPSMSGEFYTQRRPEPLLQASRHHLQCRGGRHSAFTRTGLGGHSSTFL